MLFVTHRSAFAAFWFLLALIFLQQPALADDLLREIPTWTKAGMLKGASSTEKACVRSDRVWVVDRGEGYCIRYFKNKIAPKSGIAVVIFDGDYVGSDWDARGRPIRPIYLVNFGGKALLQRTRAHTAKSKSNLVMLVSRPGQLGSSGDHKNKYKRAESRVINAALDQIKARHNLQGFVLTGHSGGATLVANLLAKRSDITCAVMDSGAVALHAYAEDAGFDSTIWATWEDPVSSIEGLRPSTTQYYILAGEGDKLRPPKYQKAFADSLAAKGASVHYLLVRKPNDPHNLQEEAIRAADLCASGAGVDKIKKGLKISKNSP